MERMTRKAKITGIYEGALEVQHMVISAPTYLEPRLLSHCHQLPGAIDKNTYSMLISFTQIMPKT